MLFDLFTYIRFVNLPVSGKNAGYHSILLLFSFSKQKTLGSGDLPRVCNFGWAADFLGLLFNVVLIYVLFKAVSAVWRAIRDRRHRS